MEAGLIFAIGEFANSFDTFCKFVRTNAIMNPRISLRAAKGRRDTGGFPGFDVINDQRQNKSWQRKRVGLTVKGAPAREGTKVFDPESGEEIGEVTSGSFGPTVNKPIAMAYLSKGFTKADTEVEVEVRGKRNKAVVTKMPFVPHKYYKP